ncbi:MAG: hypothetical protein ABIZ70_14380 [Gemmatimonadales bacterium]
MTEQPIAATLKSAGGVTTSAPATLQRFTMVDRMLRAAGFLLLGVVAAAMLIPIPIIHLVGIPLVLLVGLVTAARQLARTARLTPVRIPCPNCGAMNRVGGGLGLRNIDAPIELNCDSCRRSLTLEVGDYLR